MSYLSPVSLDDMLKMRTKDLNPGTYQKILGQDFAFFFFFLRVLHLQNPLELALESVHFPPPHSTKVFSLFSSVNQLMTFLETFCTRFSSGVMISWNYSSEYVDAELSFNISSCTDHYYNHRHHHQYHLSRPPTQIFSQTVSFFNVTTVSRLYSQSTSIIIP